LSQLEYWYTQINDATTIDSLEKALIRLLVPPINQNFVPKALREAFLSTA
jgi:hypothetical protein